MSLNFCFIALLILARAAIAAPTAASRTVAEIPAADFSRAIDERVTRVPEFQAIREEAESMGIRVWLFGGTAAGFGHYVNWDLKREKGDTRFQDDRFDYDFTNIYRSSQDADLVVDATPEQARELQSRLQRRFPYLQGSKEAWEVRTLRTNLNSDKLALLGNPDFLNQHTDSNSTGLIEITRPPKGQAPIRDLKSWDGPAESLFARDIREGKLSYLFSRSHARTSRAREGKNPPIFSAVRALIKAFQYDLEIRPADLRVLQKIIDDFDPKTISPGSYAQSWLERTGRKLMTSAVDMESAWNFLETTGLRAKLLKLPPARTDATGSLAWWMNKEPLRSKPVGLGKGATAKSLGLQLLAHGTSDFAAYESITMSRRGEPNLLISRKQASGEVAVHGDGLYTRTGRVGAGHSSFTVRLELDPEARKGSDFEVVASGILILNKNAIRVLPETRSIGPVEWFEMLRSGTVFRDEDRGILTKLQRRVENRLLNLTDEEDRKISRIVRRELQSEDLHLPVHLSVFRTWSELPVPLRNLRLSPRDRFKAVRLSSQLGYDEPLIRRLEPLFGTKAHSAEDRENIAKVVKKLVSGSTSVHPLRFWERLSRDGNYWSMEDWVALLDREDYLVAGREGVPELLSETLGRMMRQTRGGRARLAKLAKAIALTDRGPRSGFKKRWPEIDRKNSVWDLVDWVEVVTHPQYFKKEDLSLHDEIGKIEAQRLDAEALRASAQESTQAIQLVRAALVNPKANRWLGRFWLKTSLAQSHPELAPLLIPFLEKKYDANLMKVLRLAMAAPASWPALITSMNQYQLKEFIDYDYKDIKLDDTPEIRDAKAGLPLTIVKRIHELRAPTLVVKLVDSFRRDTFETWSPEVFRHTLDSLIDELAAQKNVAALEKLAEDLFHYGGRHVYSAQPQIERMIDRAASIQAPAVLNAIVENLLLLDPLHGFKFDGPLSRMIEKAAWLQNEEILLRLADEAVKNARGAKRELLASTLLDAALRLKNPKPTLIALEESLSQGTRASQSLRETRARLNALTPERCLSSKIREIRSER